MDKVQFEKYVAQKLLALKIALNAREVVGMTEVLPLLFANHVMDLVTIVIERVTECVVRVIMVIGVLKEQSVIDVTEKVMLIWKEVNIAIEIAIIVLVMDI
jgi:hypothetical protein